jgi:pyruvate/2-oxoacid:ferredoxin oxidoreductase beta subunit
MTANKKRSPRKPTFLSVAKQARKAGIEVARYEIEPSGKIVVVTGKGDSADVTANPWDAVLSRKEDHSGP